MNQNSQIMIYTNARVYTGQLPLQEAFAVKGDCFLTAGTPEAVRAAVGAETPEIDLQGHFVCAGFIDSHMHLLNYGYALHAAKLNEHTGSLADMLSCLQTFLQQNPCGSGQWLIGRGWNQDYFSDAARMPNRHDLDQVSTTVPICATRACGHCLTVNTKALELLGITAETVCPEGGEIGMEQGIPDGRFLDNAMDLVLTRIPAPDRQQLREYILEACKAVNAYGVTSCHSDDFGAFAGVSWQQVDAVYKELVQEGRLTVRVYEQSNFPDRQKLQAFVEAGNTTGTGDSFYRIGPLKMVGDGALGARTAFLKDAYADAPGEHGLSVFTQKEFDDMIGYANVNGMSAAIHAIGDACLDCVLEAIEKALQAHPRKDHRHGIVHCQITRADQLEKIAALGLHVYAQSIFLDYDSKMVQARVGKDLAATSYSWKTLMQKGVTVSNGSDCPVELPDVMRGLECAVTRQSVEDPLEPYLPEQAFTVREGIDSFTKAGAYASFEENRKGQILPGMLADFVVLSDNPFETAPRKLHEIQVLATFVGGRKVYDRNGNLSGI